jgi:hypothetical protein
VDLPSGLASDSVAATDPRTEANRHDDRRCSDSPMGRGHSVAHHRQEPNSKDQALADIDESGVDRAVIHPVMWATDYPLQDGFFLGAPQMIRERLGPLSPAARH